MFDNRGSVKGKAPGARIIPVEDLPSDISDDEWGEIQKFGQHLHDTKKKKEKDEHIARAHNVKTVLDQQVAVRAELRAKNKQDIVDFDKRILEKARQEMENESKQKEMLQSKVNAQKEMRAKMITDAKKKRDDDKAKEQQDARDQVMKLQTDLEKEKLGKIAKKNNERAAAQKVIEDNRVEKAKRVADEASNKRKDAEEIEHYLQHQIEVEKKREEAIA